MKSRIGTIAGIGSSAASSGKSPNAHSSEDEHARGQRVGDASAGGLPAGMADVDGGRERGAERGADDGARAVGQEHVAEVVVVARRGGRLDVAHRLGEVVDAQWDRGREQRRDALQAVQQQVDVQRRDADRDRLDRVADRGGLHVAADPADRAAHEQRRQADREVARQPHPGDEAGEDDHEHRQRDPQRAPHLRARPHRDERQRDAGERAEHRRARRQVADRRPDEGADQDDAADDEGPGEARGPGLRRRPWSPGTSAT